MTIFKRLAKNFKRLPRELCKFVEKKNASMRKRNFARNWARATTEKTN
jgi:hypothetical protein